MPQDWTDRSAPVAQHGDHSLTIDAFGLAELATIVDFLNDGSEGIDQ